MKLDKHDIIIKPVVTEKSMSLMGERKYTFVVHKSANKIEIGRAAEYIFGIKVERVFTMNYLGKKKRVGVHRGKRANFKKAIIQITQDSKGIEFFDSMQ